MTDKNKQIIIVASVLNLLLLFWNVWPSVYTVTVLFLSPTKKKERKRKCFRTETIRLRCWTDGKENRLVGDIKGPVSCFIVYIKRWALLFGLSFLISPVGIRRMGLAGWMCSAKQSRRLVGDDSIVIVTLHRRQEMKGPATVAKWCAQCCSSCGGGGYQTGNGSKVMVEFVRLLISYHQLCGRL